MGQPIYTIKKSVNGTETSFTPFTDDNVKKTDIVNDVTTGGTTKVLSAEMGKAINSRIDKMSIVGRYLSLWDCTTGEPYDRPPTAPYTYKSGDYYIIGKTVDKLEHPTDKNYKPNGSVYDGTPSTTVEDQDVATSYLYYFDGTNWAMLAKQTDHIRFSSLIGEPRESIPLAQEFDKYILKLPKETYSGLEYQFPFNINALVQESDKISTSFDTLVLNDGTTRGHFDMAIPLADPTNDKAGLWNKSLSDFVDVECVVSDEGEISGTVTQAQYDAILTGKAVRATVHGVSLEGPVVAVILGTPYLDKINNIIGVIMSEDYSDLTKQMSVSYVAIGDNLQIRAMRGSVGHYIDPLYTAVSGAALIQGIVIDDTQYTFDIDRSELATKDDLSSGAVTRVGENDVGSTTQPIFLNGGVPVACDYTLGDASELAKIMSTDTTTTSADTTAYTSLKVDGLLADKVSKNAAITGATACKITFDSKGLVTAGTGLAESDIPMLAIYKITDLQTTLDGKLGKNTTITAGTNCKITYDENGLITSGTTLDVVDIPALGSNKTSNMAGYVKGTSVSTILQTDTLNEAVGKLERALDDKVDKVTDYGLAKITLNGTVTDAPNIYAMGSAGSDGQIQRYNATTGKMEWFSIPASMYLRNPVTGDELGSITPEASINGEMRYCTADGVTYTSFKAGNFYLCASNGTAYNWYSIGSFIDLSAYQLKNLGTANKAVQTDASGNIAASSYTLGAACEKGVATSISSTGTDLPTSATVYQYAFDYLVLKNAPITGATKCKLTYDAKGLVTAGADLAATDIPNLEGEKINALTGYTKATAQADIAATDSLLVALGKLEKKIDDVLANYVKVKTS